MRNAKRSRSDHRAAHASAQAQHQTPFRSVHPAPFSSGACGQTGAHHRSSISCPSCDLITTSALINGRNERPYSTASGNYTYCTTLVCDQKTTDATCPLTFPPLHPPPSTPHLSLALQLASYTIQREPRYNSHNITPSPDSTSMPGRWERSKVMAVIHTVVLTAVFVLLLIPTSTSHPPSK